MLHDASPATKADLENVSNAMKAELEEVSKVMKADMVKLEEGLSLRINGVENGMYALRSDMHTVKDVLREISVSLARLRESDDQVIALIINIDKRLSRRTDDHEARIEALEEAAV